MKLSPFYAQFVGNFPGPILSKVVVGKISHVGWRRGPTDYVQFEKIDFASFLLYYKAMSLFTKMPITRENSVTERSNSSQVARQTDYRSVYFVI